MPVTIAQLNNATATLTDMATQAEGQDFSNVTLAQLRAFLRAVSELENAARNLRLVLQDKVGV